MGSLYTVTAVCLLGLAVPGHAWFWGPSWNSLKVTWGINPFSSVYFDYLPRTVSEASGEGFVVLDQAGCPNNTTWRGTRYVKDNDHSVILLFDRRGYIAGIQTSMYQNHNGWPAGLPFIQDGGRWTVTAYFVDPSIICSEGRSSEDFDEQGTGTDLYLQLTATPEESTIVPKEETGITGTKWVKGKCFYTMGQHYWYNIHEDMDCNQEFFPLFLLYNSGKLNAFGWALMDNNTSPRYEHPPARAYPKFFVTTPKCLATAGELSTQHVFLDSTPRFNFC